jgi:hypothetical protein
VIRVEPLKESQSHEWDAFLRGQPAGLFVHSSAYRDLLVGELGCAPEYLVAREGAEIRGVLPIMWTGEGGGRICNSLPYHGSHGGPVSSDPAAERALMRAWDERASDPGTVAATMIENPFAGKQFPEPTHGLEDDRISQFTVLPRAGGEKEVMELISPEARSNVRKAVRRGVSVERDNAALSELYAIHEATMAGLGAPARPRSFFEALGARLRPGEEFDVWIARVAGEVAAALLVVRFNGVSEYFASGTRPGFRTHNAHPAVVFAALVDETRRGSRIWNWGGTRRGMAGVFHFKRKWGSRERRYRYFVQLNEPSLREAAPGELMGRFPGFYVLPFSALHSSCV